MSPVVTAQTVASERGVGGRISRSRTWCRKLEPLDIGLEREKPSLDRKPACQRGLYLRAYFRLMFGLLATGLGTNFPPVVTVNSPCVVRSNGSIPDFLTMSFQTSVRSS
jgi:hypothetical protein